VVVVDTGVGLGGFRRCLDRYVNPVNFTSGRRLPYLVVCTHVHFDHVGNNFEFAVVDDALGGNLGILMGNRDPRTTRNVELFSLCCAHGPGARVRPFEVGLLRALSAQARGEIYGRAFSTTHNSAPRCSHKLPLRCKATLFPSLLGTCFSIQIFTSLISTCAWRREGDPVARGRGRGVAGRRPRSRRGFGFVPRGCWRLPALRGPRPEAPSHGPPHTRPHDRLH
jgi:hypothetical protein